ncbi:MAG: thermonuclease family protein [Deltaproteobacteria bacterium]|nr:MAG: thermonuclease family protein [Deltaproteobacteria bacterium]TMQ27885.1 MAG: thermonuclease family protein [Deltaproteobacteria bacterium]
MSVARAIAVVAALGAPGCGSAPGCGPHEAIVDRVIDGDTIVAGGATVRYLLVDAPEITDGHDDCYGASAARFNADLVLGKTVELDDDAVCEDRFGRRLAYVTAGGRDVNRLLIERGYACVLHIPPDGDARADDFAAAEAAARSERLGLWGACDPVPCR